jgi:carbamoyltransferase
VILAGVSALHHDAAVSVVDSESGEILFASHSERYSRKKNDARLSAPLIDAVKRFGPERVVWYERPRRKSARRALHFDFSFVSEDSPKRHLARLGLDLPIDYVDHHLSHAAGGAFTSPFEEAAVLVMDAIGEFETTSIWRYRDGRLERLHSTYYPQSIGLFYSAFTRAIGMKPNEEEYILMGLSAFGSDVAYADVLAEAFDLDADFPVLNRNYHHGVTSHTFARYEPKDLARATQLVYEAVFTRVLAYARRLTGSDNLVFMGGCALNCLANRLIREHFTSCWILPNPGDAGSSLGAAGAAVGRRLAWRTPYLGHEIAGEYPVEGALSALLRNECVAVASGRAEFGPRAFGNRSLFADPRGDKTRDNVNLLKKRERFRPFAPVVMEEHFSELFETRGDRASPYMQCVYTIKRPELYPAVTHVDGTSRVQTLNAEQHPGLYALLRAFFRESGCPMLLNTSLNIKGMPLVNDTNDARAFGSTCGVPVYGPAAA